jgi:hypothetical protein
MRETLGRLPSGANFSNHKGHRVKLRIQDPVNLCVLCG